MKLRKLAAICLAVVLCFSLMLPAAAASASDARSATASNLKSKNLTYGSIGGEWAAMGLARGGYTVPSCYYDSVVSAVKSGGGVLHSRKYSEYSRVIIALTAMGKDPTNVAGYDLTAPLEDFDQTIWQGINGPIWALLALDSGNYANTQRQNYVDYILDQELSGGGWALTGTVADSDITGMALQALAKYQDQKAVKAATDRALSWASKNQNKDGTFSTMGEATCESTAQILVALCELGISVDDSRFVKNGKSALDGLMSYYENGSFIHISGGSADGMATEQGLYALVAVDRAANGKSSLYRMNSTSAESAPTEAAFADIAGHTNQKAIEALVEMKIINGMGNGTFAPNKTMTRAEFCTITVKALGLEPKANGIFSDVKSTDWFAGYVGTASDKGIVNGVGGGKFNPNGTITRQEAAAMVARAAQVLKLDTAVEDTDEVLLLFTDGVSVKNWARDAMAFCALENISSWNGTLQPNKAILRCEIAQMIYNLLDAAGSL